MAESDGITGLSLNGVRKLIKDKNLPEDLLDAFSLISGVVIALSPLAVGPIGAALWPMLEPKNALIDAAKTAISKLTKSQPRDYVDQARRFAAANTLLTYAAFFDALPLCKPDILRELKLTEEEKIRIAMPAADHMLNAPPQPEPSSLADIIKVPHPVAANDLAAIDFRRWLYRDMTTDTVQGIRALVKPETLSGPPDIALADRVAPLAESLYQAEFLSMAIDYQPFSTWATLQDQADKGALLHKLSDDLHAAGEDSQLRFELLGAALHNLDLGLDRLSRAITAQPVPTPVPDPWSGVAGSSCCSAGRARTTRRNSSGNSTPPTPSILDSGGHTSAHHGRKVPPRSTSTGPRRT